MLLDWIEGVPGTTVALPYYDTLGDGSQAPDEGEVGDNGKGEDLGGGDEAAHATGAEQSKGRCVGEAIQVNHGCN